MGGYGFESRQLHFSKNWFASGLKDICYRKGGCQHVTEWLTCPLWEREIEGSNPSVLIFVLRLVGFVGSTLSLTDRVVVF